MTPDETEALAHRWHMDLTQLGNLGAADEILTPDFVAHVSGQDMPGVEGAKQLATAIRTAVESQLDLPVPTIKLAG